MDWRADVRVALESRALVRQSSIKKLSQHVVHRLAVLLRGRRGLLGGGRGRGLWCRRGRRCGQAAAPAGAGPRAIAAGESLLDQIAERLPQRAAEQIVLPRLLRLRIGIAGCAAAIRRGAAGRKVTAKVTAKITTEGAQDIAESGAIRAEQAFAHLAQ